MLTKSTLEAEALQKQQALASAQQELIEAEAAAAAAIEAKRQSVRSISSDLEKAQLKTANWEQDQLRQSYAEGVGAIADRVENAAAELKNALIDANAFLKKHAAVKLGEYSPVYQQISYLTLPIVRRYPSQRFPDTFRIVFEPYSFEADRP